MIRFCDKLMYSEIIFSLRVSLGRGGENKMTTRQVENALTYNAIRYQAK